MQHEELAVAMNEFTQSGAIPQVDASALRAMLDAVARMPVDVMANSNVSVGLGAYAGYGFDSSSLSAAEFLAISMRQNILNALIGRGVLREFMKDEQSRTKVIEAASTFPCNKDDLAEAMVQLHLSRSPAEVVEAAKLEMKSQGYDVDRPRIDGKFVEWLTRD
jgi:hypothetical protein